MTRAADWTGRVGAVWAREWARTDRSLADLSRHLDSAIADVAPEGAFRALDLGCGAGHTGLALACRYPEAWVTGIDLSPELVAVAQARAAGIANLSFMSGDATALAATSGPFDLIVSRHGVMFFDDPSLSFAKLRHAATPGARLVFSCFRSVDDNVWARALLEAVEVGSKPIFSPPPPGPFAFANPADVARILDAAGWRDAVPRAVDFAYRLGAGADPIVDALDFVQSIGPAAGPLRAAPTGERARLLARVRTALERGQVRDAIDLPAAAWIWSATA